MPWTPPVTYSASPSDQATFTTIKQVGLAGSITPGPTGGGRVFAIITGTVTNSAAGDGVQVQLSYGTGSAPVAGASATGTTIGGAVKFVTTTTNGANEKKPFCVQAIIAGLTPGTAYWLDLQGAQITGGTCQVTDATVTAFEV